MSQSKDDATRDWQAWTGNRGGVLGCQSPGSQGLVCSRENSSCASQWPRGGRGGEAQ